MTHISALQFLSWYVWIYPLEKLFIFETITQYLRNYLISCGLSPCCMMILSGLLSKRLPILECYNYLWRNLHLHIPINLHKNCFYNNPIKPNMFLQAMVDEVRGRQRDGELHLCSHEGLPQVQYLYWEERRVQPHAVLQLQTRLLLDVSRKLENSRVRILRVFQVCSLLFYHISLNYMFTLKL